MKKLIIVIVSAIMFSSCTNESKSYSILEDAGYKNIKITGWQCFECSDDDLYSTGFEADNTNNRHVKGTVCGGGMKGYTIRTN